MKIDLIIEAAAQLVTCAANGAAKRGSQMQTVGTVADAHLPADETKADGVGRRPVINRKFTGENTIEARNRVVCPD